LLELETHGAHKNGYQTTTPALNRQNVAECDKNTY